MSNITWTIVQKKNTRENDGLANPDLSAWAPKEEDPEQIWGSELSECNTFKKSYAYALSLDPEARLNYIPIANQSTCHWVGKMTLESPSLGKLTWVGSTPPMDFNTMKATKFYVCQGNVGATVQAVVEAPEVKHQEALTLWSANSEDQGWMVSFDTACLWASKKVQEWKDKIPNELGGYVDNLTPSQVYNLILDREMSERDLDDWLQHHLKQEKAKIVLTHQIMQRNKWTAKLSKVTREIAGTTTEGQTASNPPHPWIPKSEIKARARSGRCIKCGDTDHKIATCKEPHYLVRPDQQQTTPPPMPEPPKVHFFLPSMVQCL